MASASNVARSLAIGGVAPVQAQQIANQLTNLSKEQLSKGPVQVDYTPLDMRLIAPDARKYRFPNLDWEDTAAYRARKQPRKAPEQEERLSDVQSHPLGNSQPITVAQPVFDQQVVAGRFTNVVTQRRNQFAIHTVGLKIGQEKGQHPRLNFSTGGIDAVPLEWDIGQNQFLKASVQEKQSATVLMLSLENLKRVRVRLPDNGPTPQYQTILCWTEGEISSTP